MSANGGVSFMWPTSSELTVGENDSLFHVGNQCWKHRPKAPKDEGRSSVINQRVWAAEEKAAGWAQAGDADISSTGAYQSAYTIMIDSVSPSPSSSSSNQ